MEENLYETDFYSWAMGQVEALRSGNMEKLDMENLIEEVEDMAKRDKRALKSQLIRLIHHLLKWQYQPTHRGRSWEGTINNARAEIKLIFEESPSLKFVKDEMFQSAWDNALYRARIDTRKCNIQFPEDNPWDFDQAMDIDFWPDDADQIPVE